MRDLLTRITTLLIAAALIAGCAATQGPSPQASLGAADGMAAGKSLAGAPVSAAEWPTSHWWKQFRDPQLDALIDEALAGSPTLKIAEARTRKAVAAADTSRAAL